MKNIEVIYQPDCPTCNGLCCRHVTMPVHKPRTKASVDAIRWLLMHKNISVIVDLDGKWLMEIPSRCRHLDNRNKCSIYSRRPLICRDFPSKDQSCEHNAGRAPYSMRFTEHRQLERYLESHSP